MRLAAALSLLIAQQPAAVAVDARTCGQYAGEYTLVRNDVLAGLNDADKNLPAAEAALAKAQSDLRELKAAADDLQRQKAVLLDHVARLESVMASQQRACEPTVADQVAAAWEWADAPLAFAAGAGMCVGIAFALNEVSR
jgi:peptidoglycan hydrolase CwlO-like protein